MSDVANRDERSLRFGRLTRRPTMAWPLAMALGLTVLIVAFTTLAALRARDALIDGEMQRLAAWSASLADSVQRTLFDAELQLAEAERWLIEAGATGSPEAFRRVARSREAHDMLSQVVTNSHATGGLFLVDAEGRRLATQRVYPSPVLDLSQRAHFIDARARSDGGVVLSAPTRNLQTGSATLFVSRRVMGVSPDFVGTMAANLPLARFHRLFDDLESTQRLVGVVRNDGTLLLGGAATESRLAEVLAKHASTLGVQIGATASWQLADAGQGDDRHVLVARVLTGYPLAVVLASPRSVVLASWVEQTAAAAALGLVLLLAVWLVGWQAARQARLQQARADADRLAEVNEALRHEAREREQAQAALERNNASLEEQVQLRTAQLEQALLGAREASAAKSRFVSHMSHELRTPLNAVIGYTQLLEHDADARWTPAQRLHLAHVQAAGEQLLELVSDVLDLARIESGELDMSLEPVRLQPLVEEVLRTVQPMAQRRQVSLQPPHVPPQSTVQADARRLRQVLLNLLSNAIKYNREGGRVELRVRPGDDASCWRIDVADTGIGIPEHLREQLFQPFNRLGADRSVIEGTGIGLVICRHLLQGMHGGLDVTSVVGTGSTFSVMLPAALEGAGASMPPPSTPGTVPLPPAPPPPRTLAAASSSGPATVDVSPRVVLYVEDNPTNIALVRGMLARRRDLRLDAVMSAQEAHQWLADRRADVLLLDMNLGDRHGLDLLRELRAAGRLDGMPCLALSADAMPEQIAAARAMGVAGYLTKPVRMAELFQNIDAVIASKTVR